MNIDPFLRIQNIPSLRNPVILAGFAGWNDAGQVATHALTTLVKVWSAERFAYVEPDEFFVFTETRPTISLGPTGQRSLQWPANAFFWHVMDGQERDVVLLIGTEPELRWRRFCRIVLDVAEQVHASCLVTLGGLLADVPHTLPPRLTGFASTPALLPRLHDLGVQMSSYEGPTGIIGALHDSWHSAGKPALSLWGNVPHYISASPNPQISLALLERVAAFLEAPLPLGVLDRQAQVFRRQIDEALDENPEAMDYVHELEQQFGGASPPVLSPGLIDELERFLRTRPPTADDEPDQ